MQDKAVLGRKICFVATVEWPLKMFLHEQIRALSRMHEVVAVVNTDDRCFLEKKGVSIRVEPFDIKREIAPLSDVISLFRLFLFFRRSKFDLVHSINPKSGLIAMIAAFFARVPVRVHTFTGQVWVTRTGPFRQVLRLMDWLVASLASHVVTDSFSQLSFLKEQGVLPHQKGFVPGRGSVGGVDVRRFSFSKDARREIRHTLEIPDDAVVFLFVGRMNRDKGLLELAEAFCRVSETGCHAHLVIVGPDEKGMQTYVARICSEVVSRVHFIEYSATPEKYMSAADVLCLPSHREGFGTVIIEAAAVGIPAIGSRIYGLTDAIVEGETGLFHEVGDAEGLSLQMLRLAQNPIDRCRMGRFAHERAIRDFSHEELTAAMLEFYSSVLKGRR